MATTTATTTAPDARTAAAQRITVRWELGSILRRVIPEYLTLFAEDGALADLQAGDAREAAHDVIAELASAGFTIVKSDAA